MSSIKSILSTLTTTAEAATAVVSVVAQYAEGWSARSALAEQSRMLEAEYEHRIEMIAIPEEAALVLAQRIQSVSDKAQKLSHYEQAKAALASVDVVK